jgi:hypothetical protein
MPKAVLVRSGQARFLVETDDSVELPPGSALVVSETATGIPEGMQPVVGLDSLEGNFSQIKDLIVACSQSLFEAITAIPKPEKFTVEFGIKLAGEAGVPMLSKASGEASFQVSIEWTKSSLG